MPASIELQIARQYNGVINCILNSKSDPKSFDTSLINLKTIIKISDNDYYSTPLSAAYTKKYSAHPGTSL